jgi:hypothetical protein
MELKLDCGHLSDDEFVAAFEALQLKHAHFNHGDHVRLAWIYVRRCGAAGAEEKLLAGIRRMAENVGAPQKFLYTTTVAWARLVAAAIEEDSADGPFEEWVGRHEQLMDKNLLDAFYSPGVSTSDAARAGWVDPDQGELRPERDWRTVKSDCATGRSGELDGIV